MLATCDSSSVQSIQFAGQCTGRVTTVQFSSPVSWPVHDDIALQSCLRWMALARSWEDRMDQLCPHQTPRCRPTPFATSVGRGERWISWGNGDGA